MKKTVLIIEDEARIAEWVKTYFERAGFHAEVCSDGKRGLQAAQTLSPDIIILDLMLPGLSGVEVCQELRMNSDVPILMVTAKGAYQDRITGLDIGADDYIVKPFNPEELVARANAVLRRAQKAVQKTITCGPVSLNLNTQMVHLTGIEVPLSAAQFCLLKTFMQHPNQVLSRNQLIEMAFDGNFDGFDRAIDTHIRRLRKVLHYEVHQPIQTVYSMGYKYVVAEEQA